MKAKLYTVIILLIVSCSTRVNSQAANLNPGNPSGQNVSHVKSFESKYFNSQVFLHLVVNGNTESKIVEVDRSLDAEHFEVIGFIRIYGTSVQADLAYYFTDESPLFTNIYYRLSDYSDPNNPEYSEILEVIPKDINKTPATNLVASSDTDSEENFYTGGSK